MRFHTVALVRAQSPAVFPKLTGDIDNKSCVTGGVKVCVCARVCVKVKGGGEGSPV